MILCQQHINAKYVKETVRFVIPPAFLQYVTQAIVLCDDSGAIAFMNKHAQRVFHESESTLAGIKIAQLFPQLTSHRFQEIYQELAQSQSVSIFLTGFDHEENAARNFSAQCTRFEANEQTFISFLLQPVNSTRDYEEDDLLTALVDSSDDAIVSKNLQGIISSWNKGAERLFGYTAAEVIGRHISLIIPPERMDEENNILASIRQGKRVKHIDTIRITKWGEPVHVSLSISPVINKQGNIVGASKIARDISAKIKLEEERLMMTQKLIELNRHKDEFMAMASHELKTPLTIIYANLQIMDRVFQMDKNEFLVKKCIAQIRKLNLLIDDLLDVSKLQLGKLQHNRLDFIYNDVLTRSVENIREAHPQIEIVEGIELPYPVHIYGDEVRIEQALLNLLTNAIKYSPRKNKVWVNARLDKQGVVTEVIDQGIGITKEDQLRIFERFYRGSGVISTFNGSGIGLYISAKVIQLHGGSIGVESTPGKGSKFSFTLPVENEF